MELKFLYYRKKMLMIPSIAMVMDFRIKFKGISVAMKRIYNNMDIEEEDEGVLMQKDPRDCSEEM